MKFPERIYFGEADKSVLDVYSTKEHDDEVEYVRNDVFIEKACEWLESLYAPNGSIAPCHAHIIENFKKYMKGE